jgi:hypothetical protein
MPRPKGEKSEVAAVYAKRRLDAVTLKAQGASYRAIGEALGVSHTQAIKDVKAGLLAYNRELGQVTADGLVALQDARLESAIRRANKMMAEKKDMKVADLVSILEHLRKVSAEQRKLHGLDAPNAIIMDVLKKLEALEAQDKARGFQN